MRLEQFVKKDVKQRDTINYTTDFSVPVFPVPVFPLSTSEFNFVRLLNYDIGENFPQTLACGKKYAENL